MENLVVSLETAKKLKAAGFTQDTANWWWLEEDGDSTLVRHKNDSRWVEDIAAPTAQEIADQLPDTIESRRYKHRESQLRIGKSELGTYFAWYFVIDIKDVESDFGEHAPTMAEALALLWLKLQEGK